MYIRAHPAQAKAVFRNVSIEDEATMQAMSQATLDPQPYNRQMQDELQQEQRNVMLSQFGHKRWPGQIEPMQALTE